MQNNIPHPEDDQLEQYALGRLTGTEAATVEEHILLCSACQERLQAEDEYLSVMRAALEDLKTESVHPFPGHASGFLRSLPKRAILSSLAFAAVLVLAVSASYWNKSRPPYTLRLESQRGGPASVTATAPAGLPLRLIVDLTGLNQRPARSIEISDAVGRSVWESALRIVNGAASVDVPDPLPAGQYWVRIYDSGNGSRGQLLREYNLRLE